ncbi:hypothetical protein ACQW02_25910 [Humitalea sp. 24SJ18S-53]|uniref:hypothetical protein n=1 Tax=Humitalea sp. 24SJ18S-53 TaxID=3422307 RepID=UPI003D668ED7
MQSIMIVSLAKIAWIPPSRPLRAAAYFGLAVSTWLNPTQQGARERAEANDAGTPDALFIDTFLVAREKNNRISRYACIDR